MGVDTAGEPCASCVPACVAPQPWARIQVVAGLSGLNVEIKQTCTNQLSFLVFKPELWEVTHCPVQKRCVPVFSVLVT